MQNGVQNGVSNGVVTEELLNDVNAKLTDENAKETVLARISTVTKPGITRNDVVDQYSDWVKNSDYEDVSIRLVNYSVLLMCGRFHAIRLVKAFVSYLYE